MTSIGRAGTHQSQNFIMEQINNNNAKYVDLQQQVTSGYKTQRYSGIADDAGMTVNLSDTESTLKQYVKSGDAINTRLSAGSGAVSDMLDVLSDFRAQLIQAMTSDQADDGRIDIVADGYMKQIESALNTNLGGTYIFGGTKSDAKPVDLSDPIANANGTYYSGAGERMTSRIDDNTVLSYGATADYVGFKKLISSLQRVSSASGSLDQLEVALDEANTALDSLTQLEAQMGHEMKVVEGAIGRNEDVQSTITNQLANLRDTDVAATMVELTQRETILQASYTVISRANKMTLANYLS